MGPWTLRFWWNVAWRLLWQFGLYAWLIFSSFRNARDGVGYWDAVWMAATAYCLLTWPERTWAVDWAAEHEDDDEYLRRPAQSKTNIR